MVYTDFVCLLRLLHNICTSIFILISGLCLLFHNFYCIFSCYLPSTRPGLKYLYNYSYTGPPLWSSGQSFWLHILRSRIRFPVLPDFLRSSGSGTGSTQPREDSWGATSMKSSSFGEENLINGRGDPLRWPRDTLYPQKFALTRWQAVVARSV
jgi:hypothetical protein